MMFNKFMIAVVALATPAFAMGNLRWLDDTASTPGDTAAAWLANWLTENQETTVQGSDVEKENEVDDAKKVG